ncbi:MAG: FHA domain-containing protein [Alphaproteobacteria bacterium]|nr:FHA domain-containing protein [Alphaproteobacteria bacterium]
MSTDAWVLRVIAWPVTPDRPATTDRLRDLAGRLRGRGMAEPEPFEGGALPADAPGVATVLHLVGSGPDAPALLAEALRGGGPELARWMAALPLLIFDVPGGGVRALATTLVKRGSGHCLLPREGAPAGAFADFTEVLYVQLAQGALLIEAVKAGEAMARVRSGSEQAATFLGKREEIHRPLVSKRWRPPGWPPVGEAVAEVLDRTFAEVRRRRSGFVGLELLALALMDGPPVEGLEPLAQALRPRRAALRRGWEELLQRGAQPADLCGTPRLQALGASVPRGCDGAALAKVLEPAFEALLGSLGDDAEPDEIETILPARRLEVLGGPEDGRVIELSPGDRVGRGGEGMDAEHTLYAETRLHDPRLSRRHIEWLSPGRLVLGRPAQVRSGGEDAILGPGACELYVGDVLALTRSTWLRGLA